MHWSTRASRSRPGCRTSGWPRSATRLVARGIPLRTLTREEECFGYAAGYRAAGGMPLVLLQCSGLGQLAQRARLARRSLRLRLPGRAVDARDARRAQPVPDAARPHHRGHARAARRPAVPARPAATTPRSSRGAVATAEGARVLAPIILESILDLAMNPTSIVARGARRRPGRAVRLLARHRRPPRCARRATTARTSTWAARWAPRWRRRSASPRSGRTATSSRSSATARR